MEFKKAQQEPIADYSQDSLHKEPISRTTKILILGIFVFSSIIPLYANASIFAQIASFFGGDAKAETIDNGQNSQTAPVLEAKMISNTETISEEPLKMNSDDVLMPEVGALGTALDIEDYPEEDEINVYITKRGDTLSNIAKMYKVSINTIVWANDGLDPKKPLKEGTSLLIMPISGVSHTITRGDTLNKIAKKYSADANEIARFNGVTDETINVGDSIIVPNGELAAPKKTTNNIAKKATNTIGNLKVYAGNGKGTSRYISGYDGPSQGGYYRKPVLCIITQGLHGKNGIDMGCKVGTPVAAAAPGTVIAARGGWNGGYGNMIIISHPNGTQTLYGHLSRISVSTGQDVGDGEIIGATGNSGQSTGPHLHFEVRGARNCYVDGSCR